MKIQIRRAALGDLTHGFAFYESQQTGLGGYFLDCLFADIDSLVYTQAFTANASEHTASYRAHFRTPFTTTSSKIRHT